MEIIIKYEIYYILFMYLMRVKELKGKYSILVINMVMDIVVNKFLNNLLLYVIILEWVNLKYFLKFELYEFFEYYVEKI